MKIEEWSRKWNIPEDAMRELKFIYGIHHSGTLSIEGKSESAVSNIVRLEASQRGCRIWRNNVGATYTHEGNFIRFGLANESSQVNSKIKSADLIGIKPVKITNNMVGYTIGQFLSREIKKSNWRYTGTDRERAQLAWADLILSLGGDACFAIGEGTL